MTHEKTRYMDIYAHLSKAGFEVYSPGQKTGECKEPYIVVKDAGTLRYGEFSSTQTLYDIMCYVPKVRFTFLEQYVLQMKQAMKGLAPMIMPTYTETASFYDDSVKGHMISVQYRNMKQIV